MVQLRIMLGAKTVASVSHTKEKKISQTCLQRLKNTVLHVLLYFLM